MTVALTKSPVNRLLSTESFFCLSTFGAFRGIKMYSNGKDVLNSQNVILKCKVTSALIMKMSFPPLEGSQNVQ